MQDIKEVSSILSDRITALSESQTIAMAKKARELAAQGHDVINLSFGEPDFQTPQYIKDAAKKAIDDGFTFYTPVPGYPELRQAIADKFKRDNNLDYKPENIVVSTGAKQSIANAVMCLVNPGDEVIIFSPYWVSYEEIVKLAEGVPVQVMGSLENDFKVTPAQLEAAITSNTKLIMYSSPCNPTGSVFTAEELLGLAKVLEKYPKVHVIADEIYEYINFEGEHASMASFDFIKDRVITVNGFSKGYAMTGWRVGYIAAHKDIAAACDKMQSQITSGTCSIAQKAAYAALQGGKDSAIEMRNAYFRRRNLVLELMNDIPGFKTNVPEGAFYIFPDVSYYFGMSYEGKTIQNALDLCMYLLTDALVAVVSGEAFGAPQCVRFSYATSDEKLVEALRRIKESLAKLQ
ncbi:pyridoxal phosphate-dependent aminotransferase [Pontibacter sp. BT310]|uniref:Aminotransferase n=1 Tax=Pontibacter populi TaxID=890055 RepID=A0ABS6XG87_9BACT|nr:MULTISPECIES: pyridoxal phosphate-dependent aminotransferase [Pontibacter]MBJ6119316.1 pyridoxal phosphate-dependent aminotransferase [Pontibacter sp. BT310]MBR0571744.1 pyridoxal phosphate-dependent aminotransferase [Microvirga sp. STS03]MBW3366170.1 pyridoxal phosphate-dependent aminotransferase [Pontibacter populi]